MNASASPAAAAPVAVVTGASRGIGRAIALRLAEDGWRVWALSRGGAEAPETDSRIASLALDVADTAAVARFFAARAKENIRLNVLVNNAAIQGGAPVEEQSQEEWQRFLDVNVTAPWLLAKHALPLLRAAEGASIINIGSVASVAGFAERAAYCASKHALAGLTRALAVELAAARIRVNLLCLGTFDTPGLRALADETPGGLAAFAKRQLLNRNGEAEEAAAACAFLASEESGFMTGSVMTVDGGMTSKGALA